MRYADPVAQAEIDRLQAELNHRDRMATLWEKVASDLARQLEADPVAQAEIDKLQAELRAALEKLQRYSLALDMLNDELEEHRQQLDAEYGE